MLATGLALAISACGAGGTSASPTSGPPTDPGLSPEPAPSGSAPAAHPADPSAPVVYLLGGSSARECVVGNAAWSQAIREAGGPRCRATDLGSTNETFLDDRRLVKVMKTNTPTLLLVGVSIGRYTSDVAPGRLDKPLPPEDVARLAGQTKLEHRYSVTHVKTPAEKEELVARWLSETYPRFRENYKANLEQLELLIEDAQAKGFRVAILELPMDLALIGDRFDAPREQYADDAERVARSYGVPYLSFLDELGLPNEDYYDLLHLVEPGREKWQARLSDEVAGLLDEYGMGAGK